MLGVISALTMANDVEFHVVTSITAKVYKPEKGLFRLVEYEEARR